MIQNRTYHHRVKSKDTRGQPPYSASAWSNTTATKVPAARQQAPDAQVRAVGAAAAEIAWTRYEVGSDVTPATRQEIQGSKDRGVTWTAVASNLKPSVQSYTHTGLTTGDTWHYRVRVLNAGGWSEWSLHEADAQGATTAPSATIGQNAGPMPPTGVTATPEGPTNIHVKWEAPADTGSSPISWYEIECTDDGQFPSHACYSYNAWPGFEWIDHLGLTGGDEFSYRVRAYNEDDNPGAWSDIVKAQTKAGSPQAPPALDAEAVDKSSIKLTWTAPPETVSRYIVERYDHHVPDDQFAEVINNISGTATTWTDTGLYEGSGYSYRIRGYNSKGYGAWSYQAAAYTDGRYPQEPGRIEHIYRTALSANSVTVAWETPADDGGRPITGYGYEMTHSCGTDGRTEITSGTKAATSRTATISLSGVECEAVYFDVWAKNMIGDGENSWGHTTYRPNYGGKGSLNINRSKIVLNEGSSTTLTVSLSQAPTKNLTLWYNWDGDSGAAFALDAAQALSITPSNWNSIPAITVTAPTDANTDDETASLNFVVETDVTCPAGHRDTREACNAYIEENKDPKFHYVSGNGLLVTFRDTGAN